MKPPHEGTAPVAALAARLSQVREEQGLLLFLDYDGTLVEIAPRPELARPIPELLQLLARLGARPDVAVVVVSGRPVRELQELLPVPGLHYLGSHGAEGLIGGQPWTLPGVPDKAGELAGLKRQLVARLAGLGGWWLEDKPQGAALHFRQATPAQERRILAALKPWLAQVTRERPFQVLWGKKVAEVLPAGVSKGAAVRQLWVSPGFSGRFPIYIGDDTTDESAFQILEGQGLTIKVGGKGGATAAAHFLSQPTEVHQLLALLAV
jgi:trehalose 6-phosphate phosphatase